MRWSIIKTNGQSKKKNKRETATFYSTKSRYWSTNGMNSQILQISIDWMTSGSIPVDGNTRHSCIDIYQYLYGGL